jgi:site-specific DNA-methyltransferase (adenine-specific)
MTRVDAVNDDWDQFSSFEAYDAFCRQWLKECRRVLKDNGTIWVIGTYHNIFRLGTILQDLGYWILNDVIWVKTNPMPNFLGVRFTNAHETLIWAKKDEKSKYTFNYHGMKGFNRDKQMRSDWWLLSHAAGAERLKVDGKKAHSTQKPESLLYRVLLAATNPGDVVLDPFFGSGTTGAVAKKLHRQWVGIEKEAEYVAVAQARIDAIQAAPFDEEVFDLRSQKRKDPRIPFSAVLENGLLAPGQELYYKKQPQLAAKIKPNGKLRLGEQEGSIHQLGRKLSGGSPCNGWDHWYYETAEGEMLPLESLRQRLRDQLFHGEESK